MELATLRKAIPQEVETLAKKQQENYNERLKKYFKRYNKHIYACGYWANR